MANVKITDLSAYTNPAATDVLPIVDVGANATKKVSIQDLLKNAGSGTAALPGIAFDGDLNTGIYRPDEDQLALSAGGTQRLLIDASGNVNVNGDARADGLYGYGDTDTGIEFPGSDVIAFKKGGADAARIDSSGRLLLGTSDARATSGVTPQLQIESTTQNGSSFGLYSNANDATGPFLLISKSRSGSIGESGPVLSGDTLGNVRFVGNDGSANIAAAQITAQVDGTPGANYMPGRLTFSVTESGNSSPTTSPSAMTINNGQEVLIGYSTDNGAYKLQVNSQIFATSDTIATSDGRYKENVAALDGCVDLVKALRPVSFDWKAQEPVTRVDEDGETVVVREAHNFPDGKQVGFIAQEVEEVLADKPWLGSVIKQNVRPSVTDADGNELAPEEEFLGIAKGNLVAVLTSALKDAIGRIESLEAEVAALKA